MSSAKLWDIRVNPEKCFLNEARLCSRKKTGLEPNMFEASQADSGVNWKVCIAEMSTFRVPFVIIICMHQ